MGIFGGSHFKLATLFIAFCSHGGPGSQAEDSILVRKSGYPAIVDTPQVWTAIGAEAAVSSKLPDYSQQLDQCLWWVSSSVDSKGPHRLVFKYTKGASNVSPDGRYEIDENLFAAGECKIKINEVNTTDFGFWNCTLISNESGTFTGGVQVDKYAPPTFLPAIENFGSYKGMRVNPKNPVENLRDVTCCAIVEGAKPEPDLYFEIVGSSGIIAASNGTRVEDVGPFQRLCKVWKNAPFDYVWNTKSLVCGETHPAFSETDMERHKHIVILDILYSPVIVGSTNQENSLIKVSKSASMVEIAATVMGNPLPQVVWEALGESYIPHSRHGIAKVEETVEGDTISSIIIFEDASDIENNTQVIMKVSTAEGDKESLVYTVVFEDDYGGISWTLYFILFAVLGVIVLVVIGVFIFYTVRRAKRSGTMPVTFIAKAERRSAEGADLRELRRNGSRNNRASGESSAEGEARPVITDPIPISLSNEDQGRNQSNGDSAV